MEFEVGFTVQELGPEFFRRLRNQISARAGAESDWRLYVAGPDQSNMWQNRGSRLNLTSTLAEAGIITDEVDDEGNPIVKNVIAIPDRGSNSDLDDECVYPVNVWYGLDHQPRYETIHRIKRSATVATLKMSFFQKSDTR